MLVYERGGKVWIGEDQTGLVFLEKDWDGGTLPQDLIGEAGVLFGEVSLLTPEERAKQGISDGLIRFSVGIEEVEDLQHDILQALTN